MSQSKAEIKLDQVYTDQRITMVKTQLMTVGVKNDDILCAFLETPKEQFVDEKFASIAYSDAILPQTGGCAILCNADLARILEAAEINPEDEVLNIGAGSGYSSCLIAKLANSVIAIEYDKPLAIQASHNVATLKISNISVKNSSYFDNIIEGAPFDVIILNGYTKFISEIIVSQLKEGGRMMRLEPAANGVQIMAVKYTKSQDGSLSRQELFHVQAEQL